MCVENLIWFYYCNVYIFYVALRVICHWMDPREIHAQFPDEETDSEAEIASFKYGISFKYIYVCCLSS